MLTKNAAWPPLGFGLDLKWKVERWGAGDWRDEAEDVEPDAQPPTLQP